MFSWSPADGIGSAFGAVNGLLEFIKQNRRHLFKDIRHRKIQEVFVIFGGPVTRFLLGVLVDDPGVDAVAKSVTELKAAPPHLGIERTATENRIGVLPQKADCRLRANAPTQAKSGVEFLPIREYTVEVLNPVVAAVNIAAQSRAENVMKLVAHVLDELVGKVFKVPRPLNHVAREGIDDVIEVGAPKKTLTTTLFLPKMSNISVKID